MEAKELKLEKLIETTRYNLTPKECIDCPTYILCDIIEDIDGKIADAVREYNKKEVW